MENVKNSNQKREYLIGLMKKRSIIALCSGILELIFVFFALMMGFNKISIIYDTSVFQSYRYFTMISNTMAALSITFVIPFAVEGIRNNRFILPRWVSVLLFISTNSISIVLILVISLLRYTSPDEVFGNGGVYAHFVCPVLVLILFFQIEGGHQYKRRERILACLPFCLYLVVYYIMVVVVGKENGGWDDIYHVTGYISSFLSITIGTVVAYIMSLLISKLSNYLTVNRSEKKYSYLGKEAEPVEVLTEAYGLGIMMANNMDKEIIELPYDILEELSKRYDIAPSRIIRAFIKGLETGVK